MIEAVVVRGVAFRMVGRRERGRLVPVHRVKVEEGLDALRNERRRPAVSCPSALSTKPQQAPSWYSLRTRLSSMEPR